MLMRIGSFLLLFSWFACVSEDTFESTNEITATIRKVEDNLRTSVHFVGDSTWSILDRMLHYGVPGVSIAVIKDSKIHWANTYGVMDKDTKEPVTPQTLFQAGSISKPVAAYGALNMMEQGLLKLDAPVNQYLRSWQIPENAFTTQQPVTLKHLVSHTGGLTVHGFLGYTIREEVPNLIQVLDGIKPANSPPIQVDKLPGESFRYSGGGYCVMQQMMIDLEGKSFPQILKARVLDPLQMQNSTFEQPLPADKLTLAATGYLPDGSMTPGKRHTYPEMAAAGLWTTAEDLARFAIDIQLSLAGKGRGILSPDLTSQMLTPVTGDFIGLGIFIDQKSNEIYFGHGGWDEGFSSEMVAHKDRGYGAVILTNSNHPDFIKEVIRAIAHTYAWEEYLPPVYKKMSLDLDHLKDYLGRYRFSSDQQASIYAENDRLFIQYPRNPPEELFRIAENHYVRKEREKLVTFLINPADTLPYLVFQDEGKRDVVEYLYPQMAVEEEIPYQYIEEGNFEKAINAYRELIRKNPGDPDIQESQINRVGYQLLEQKEFRKAIDVFRLNTLLYPASFNVYDSLGEAYLKSGDQSLAIQFYQKSLAINPANEGAIKALKEMGVL